MKTFTFVKRFGYEKNKDLPPKNKELFTISIPIFNISKKRMIPLESKDSNIRQLALSHKNECAAAISDKPSPYPFKENHLPGNPSFIYSAFSTIRTRRSICFRFYNNTLETTG